MKRLILLLAVLLTWAATSQAEEVAGSDAVAIVSLPGGAAQDMTIDREVLRDQAEAAEGEKALRQLIDYSLVMQKAAIEGITISDAEVSDSIAERAKTDEKTKRNVQNGGVQLRALQHETRYQIALDKLLTRNVKADEATVRKWFATRHEYYDQPERVRIGFLLTSSRARAHTMAAQLQSYYKTFSELVEEQKKSKDAISQNSELEAPELTPVKNLPATIKPVVSKLKFGQSSGILRLGESPRLVYAIVRVTERPPFGKADFDQMRSRATMDYKLEQVARKLNGTNPLNPSFDHALNQVTGYSVLRSGEDEPDSLRGILHFMNQATTANLLLSLQQQAHIKILDPDYRDYAQQSTSPEADSQ